MQVFSKESLIASLREIVARGNREALAIEIDSSLPAARVIRLMEQLAELHGLPVAIRCDNGAELTSLALTEWCRSKNIHLAFIDPGKPDANRLTASS